MVFCAVDLRKCTFFVLIFSTLVFVDAFAQGTFRLFISADTDPSVRQSIEQGMARAITGRRSKIVLHQAKDSSEDPAVLRDALRQASDGVMIVSHGLNTDHGWMAKVLAEQQTAIPVIGIGVKTPVFDQARLLFFGAETKDYADLSIKELQAFNGDILCLYAHRKNFCQDLQSNYGDRLEMQEISPQASTNVQMALTVSAMTKNPQITNILMTDWRIIPQVTQALRVIKGAYVLGIVAQENLGHDVLKVFTQGFAIDPQWSLQAFLALSLLQEQFLTGQKLFDSVRIRPRVLKRY